MKFEKVSDEEFKNSLYKFYIYAPDTMKNVFHYFKYDLPLPVRTDKGSCGYDFYSPIHVELNSENTFIPTGIKVQLDDDKLLALFPRSSCAKHYYQFGNQTGIIDASYYNNPGNEGHIYICLRTVQHNVNNTDHSAESFDEIPESIGFGKCIVRQGDRIGQGVILPFFTVDNDYVKNTTRTGGFGSSGK